MIVCKRCESANIVKSGIVRGRQRYQCKDCNYVFLLKDRRRTNEANLRKALYLLMCSLGAVSYDVLEELLDRDRSLLSRWNQASGSPKQRSKRNAGACKIDCTQLETYVEQNKKLFDPSAPLFVSSGTMLSGEYTAILIVQRKQKTNSPAEQSLPSG